MKKEKKGTIGKIWDFLTDDSWQSLLVFFVLAIIFIKFIFFPTLSALTGSPLPLVIVESCSMYHFENGFEQTFESDVYKDKGISIEDTNNWDFKNGLNKGDVIFVVGPKNKKIGDIVIFNGGENHPIIHRLIKDTEPYSTKGDNYKTNYLQLPAEKEITSGQMIGRAVFKIPYIGWIKLIFFEPFRPSRERGLCS